MTTPREAQIATFLEVEANQGEIRNLFRAADSVYYSQPDYTPSRCGGHHRWFQTDEHTLECLGCQTVAHLNQLS